MPAIGAVRQVALSAGRDLDATLAFWRDVLSLNLHARYDPPGIAFIMAGDVRLLFTDGVPAGTVYFDIAGLETFHAEAKAAGIPFTAPPTLVHRDTEGQFGPAGKANGWPF